MDESNASSCHGRFGLVLSMKNTHIAVFAQYTIQELTIERFCPGCLFVCLCFVLFLFYFILFFLSLGCYTVAA